MRDLKFRAWDFDNKWMERDFWIGANGVTFGEPSRYFDTPNTEIQEEPNLIVMQFTGLKDKNGVEICEGDIVKFLDTEDQSNESNGTYSEDFTNIGSVYYSDDFNGWDVSGREVDRDDVFFEIEVVGNIYENPELLKSNGE